MADSGDAHASLRSGQGAPPEQAIVTALGQARTAAAVEAAQQATDGDHVTFVGFSGRTITRPGGKRFQLFYLDPGQRSWLLVEVDGIRYHEEIKDDAAPGGRRTMIWVHVDAAVGRGGGRQSDEAKFLTGDFCRAADFSPSMGEASGAATGVFCEARSPSCCYGRSRP